jgi:segregation and condensation protein A
MTPGSLEGEERLDHAAEAVDQRRAEEGVERAWEAAKPGGEGGGGHGGRPNVRKLPTGWVASTAAVATFRRVAPAVISDLELDLEVFSGPFDLMLTLVLREEVDLLEIELADVVIAYLDFLESRGELDLEAATEFLVLIAALLELKSRLMLPREDEELLELEPGEAAEELLARMLEARRYRRAAEHLAARLADEEGHRFRSAPLPTWLRRVTDDDAAAVYDPAQLGEALGGLLRMPPPLSVAHLTTQRVTVAERLAHLRGLLRRGACSFDEAVRGADRVTVAVTLFALLELYKQGEVTWRQEEPFGDIAISAHARVPEAGAEGIAS